MLVLLFAVTLGFTDADKTITEKDLLGEWVLTALAVGGNLDRGHYVFQANGEGKVLGRNGDDVPFVWCIQKGSDWDGKILYVTSPPGNQAGRKTQPCVTAYEIMDKRSLRSPHTDGLPGAPGPELRLLKKE